jgi:inorganic triphosphatase YgiF
LKQEIELKLEVGPGSLQVLSEMAIWQGHTRQTLNATYFDTPGLALNKAGLSLRLRQGIQTLKAVGPQGMGLFARGEWEGPAPNGVLDLDRFKGTPLDLMDLRLGDLLPIIEVEVDRSTLVVNWQQSRIELSLDQGTVWADSHQAPLCELELELIEGRLDDLFDLAKRIGQTVRLIPALTSKAGRGYALLARPESGRPDRLASPDISGLTRGQAFFRLATDILAQILVQSEAVRLHRRPEAVHQTRVALRRLRALISLFASILAGPDLAAVKASLKSVTQALGPARDLDVLIADLSRLDPAPQVLIATLSEQQGEAYDAACQMIETPEFGVAMVSILRFLESGAWRTATALQGHRRDRSVAKHARKTLKRLRQALKRQGRGLIAMSPPQMHALRIRAKKLRYGLEMFASLYPRQEPARQAVLKTVRSLQDQLGAANDKAVGLALIATHPDIISQADLDTLSQRLWPDKAAARATAQKTLQTALSLAKFWSAKA